MGNPVDRILADADSALADPILLTVKEYAARYRVHVQTVYTAIRLGRLQHGRVVRVTGDAIRIEISSHDIPDRIGA